MTEHEELLKALLVERFRPAAAPPPASRGDPSQSAPPRPDDPSVAVRSRAGDARPS
jgi:hypothetical protein